LHTNAIYAVNEQKRNLFMKINHKFDLIRYIYVLNLFLLNKPVSYYQTAVKPPSIAIEFPVIKLLFGSAANKIPTIISEISAIRLIGIP
jgi:hypothetical protein